jgi:hypothetical protein
MVRWNSMGFSIMVRDYLHRLAAAQATSPATTAADTIGRFVAFV